MQPFGPGLTRCSANTTREPLVAPALCRLCKQGRGGGRVPWGTQQGWELPWAVQASRRAALVAGAGTAPRELL